MIYGLPDQDLRKNKSESGSTSLRIYYSTENYSKKQVFSLTNRGIVPIYVIYSVKTRFSKRDMLYYKMCASKRAREMSYQLIVTLYTLSNYPTSSEPFSRHALYLRMGFLPRATRFSRRSPSTACQRKHVNS